MNGFLLFVTTVVVLLGIPAGFAWAVVRARRRGLGGSFVGPFQEMWDPGALRIEAAIQEQAEQEAPAPAPRDPPSPARRG